jgi:FKBP-type peptidyl-prolyl cis-trans isomerase FklB
MDSKIEHKRLFSIGQIIVVLLPLTMLLCPSCKENKWAEWKVQNQIWLEQNRTKDGVLVTASGLQYKIIADPTPQDALPNSTSTITCDYQLELINGYIVEPWHKSTLSLPNTIPGFREGCHLVHNNGDIELYIPYWLGYDYEKATGDDEYNAEGYGTEGTQAYIPPYSTLIYTIHICSVTGE